jgi:hypothetical protein
VHSFFYRWLPRQAPRGETRGESIFIVSPVIVEPFPEFCKRDLFVRRGFGNDELHKKCFFMQKSSPVATVLY